MTLLRALPLLLLLFPAAAPAEVYVWTDAEGRTHMTDDVSTIPPAYRKPRARRDPARDDRRWNEVPGSIAAPHSAAPRGASPALRPGAGRSTPTSGPGAVHVLRVQRAGREMVLRATLDGGVRVPFVVDTGAMLNTIPAWAVEKLGIRIDDRTPVTALSGIGGRAMLVPVITLRSVRVGDAVVQDVELAVLDTMQKGLLGMPFFNHFKVSTDPAAGTLTLEEIDLGAVEGIYGGLDQSSWRAKFGWVRAQLAGIEQARSQYQGFLGADEKLDRAEVYWQHQLDELDRKATRAGVPYAWRE